MKRCLLPIAIGIWSCSVVAGLVSAARYQSRPAAVQEAADSEPQVRAIVRTEGVPTLVMFLHPECPCSRASLHELERVLARVRNVNANVVALQYGDRWSESPLVAQASSMANVNVIRDETGSIATEFGATTSGEVFAYAADGKTVFHGGITASRGHEGDSDGSSALLSVLNKQASKSSSGPVFGCPLFSAETK